MAMRNMESLSRLKRMRLSPCRPKDSLAEDRMLLRERIQSRETLACLLAAAAENLGLHSLAQRRRAYGNEAV
jgi:hypothetical protein